MSNNNVKLKFSVDINFFGSTDFETEALLPPRICLLSKALKHRNCSDIIKLLF